MWRKYNSQPGINPENTPRGGGDFMLHEAERTVSFSVVRAWFLAMDEIGKHATGKWKNHTLQGWKYVIRFMPWVCKFRPGLKPENVPRRGGEFILYEAENMVCFSGCKSMIFRRGQNRYFRTLCTIFRPFCMKIIPHIGRIKVYFQTFDKQNFIYSLSEFIDCLCTTNISVGLVSEYRFQPFF